jgi:restriction system protein
MADHFNLTPEERGQMLPSTRATYIKHRTGWASFGLRKAGLATNPVEGTLQITDDGRKFLATNPSGRLPRSVLMQFEPFRHFTAELKERAAAAAKKTDALPHLAPDGASDDQITPEERIGSAFAELNAALVTELLSRLAQIDPFRFEQVVLDLLVKMGYGGSFKEAAAVTQKTGDEGIDGVINQDRLGLDVIYVQAKRWKAMLVDKKSRASLERWLEGKLRKEFSSQPARSSTTRLPTPRAFIRKLSSLMAGDSPN